MEFYEMVGVGFGTACIDNNIKEIVISLISYNLENEISHKVASDLSNEKYCLTLELLEDFIQKWYDNPDNFVRFSFLEPLIRKGYFDKLLELFKVNNGVILINIKPRHLITMVARNKKINYNAILFALSHNKNMRLRYQDK